MTSTPVAVKVINIRFPLGLKKRLSDESYRQSSELPGNEPRISLHRLVLEACELYLEMSDEERQILRDRAETRAAQEKRES